MPNEPKSLLQNAADLATAEWRRASRKYPQLRLAVLALAIVLGAAYFVKRWIL